jgi:hypothetical protein
VFECIVPLHWFLFVVVWFKKKIESLKIEKAPQTFSPFLLFLLSQPGHISSFSPTAAQLPPS